MVLRVHVSWALLLAVALGGCASQASTVGPGDHPLLSEEEAGPPDPTGDPYAGGLKEDDPLPAWVSHEELMTPVRDQGKRATCMAFSLCAALEGYYQIGQHLSTEQLWTRMEKGTVGDGDRLGDAVGATLCPDRYWPYGGQDSPACEAHEDYLLPSLIKTGTDPLRLKMYLAENERTNIVLSIRWVKAYEGAGGWLVGPEGTDWEQERKDCMAAGTCGWHAVLLVGYHELQDADGAWRAFFRFKNSWGANWGDGGYGDVSADYLRKFGRWGAVIRPVAQ